MKIKDLLAQGKLKEVLSSDWGMSWFLFLYAQYNKKESDFMKGLIPEVEFDLFKNKCMLILQEHGDINIPLFKIGDKVKPSKTCRPLYGDPTILTITQIRENKYLTDIYSIWFEEHELSSFD